MWSPRAGHSSALTSVSLCHYVSGSLNLLEIHEKGVYSQGVHLSVTFVQYCLIISCILLTWKPKEPQQIIYRCLHCLFGLSSSSTFGLLFHFFFLLILQNFSQGLLQWIIPKWDLVLIFMQDFLPDSTNPVYPRWDRHLEDKGPLVAGYDEQRKVCVFPRNASTAPTSCTHYPWLRCDHHRGSLMTWLLQH